MKDQDSAADRLSRYGWVLTAYWIVAAVVSLWARWPGQFGGAGDPANVGAEFLSRGTAAAPPLFLIAVLALAAWTVRKSGAWRNTSAIVLTVLGLAFTLGGVGEILAPDPVTTPRIVLYITGSVAVVVGSALAGLGVAALMRRAAQGAPRRVSVIDAS